MSMEHSASASSLRQSFLKSKLRVGSVKNDSINYNLSAKVFHTVDVPRDKLEVKKAVQKFKKANILGMEKQEWNQSTISDPRIQKDVNKDLKRQLLEVRAGLSDQKTIKASKEHTDEKIKERYKYIVQTGGKGPIGKLSGQWFNPVDERGLARHCIEESWNDWNESSSTNNRDDSKLREAKFKETEEKRILAQSSHPKLDKTTYINPTQSIANVNHRLRERKIDFQELKEQFKHELRAEFPSASEERIQAMSQRLLNEKLLADEKMARFPVQHESFRPNLSLTTEDRRYRTFHHPGQWGWIAAERRYGWSCCMNFAQESCGCENKIVNPDSWCTLGFERYHTG